MENLSKSCVVVSLCLNSAKLNRMFAVKSLAVFTTHIAIRIIFTFKTNAISLNAINIGKWRKLRTGFQQRNNLGKHNTDIVGVRLVDIANFRRPKHTSNFKPMITLKVKVITVKYRSEFMAFPTIKTTLIFIAPMRAPNVPTRSA